MALAVVALLDLVSDKTKVGSYVVVLFLTEQKTKLSVRNDTHASRRSQEKLRRVLVRLRHFHGSELDAFSQSRSGCFWIIFKVTQYGYNQRSTLPTPLQIL